MCPALASRRDSARPGPGRTISPGWFILRQLSHNVNPPLSTNVQFSEAPWDRGAGFMSNEWGGGIGRVWHPRRGHGKISIRVCSGNNKMGYPPN